MDKYVIIVAGGTGSRMGKDTPKQFLLLAGKPLLAHSIEAFYRYDPLVTIIVALHPGYVENWAELCRKFSFTVPHQIIPGGSARFFSVKNALSALRGEGLVAVHDAARPLISVELISRSFREAAIHGNAIPGIPVNETVRSVNHGNIRLLDRSTLQLIQTPQTFETGLLKKAYDQDYRAEFTDDASLIEAMGLQIHLIPGDPRNIKITLPGDIQIAELFLL
jgi:2-C-methyl-D-erythritol 4-phosphate cytidylyltransferase